MNNINVNVKNELEKQARKEIKLHNDNFQFQTNKMWPLKGNEPLTIYKARKSPSPR